VPKKGNFEMKNLKGRIKDFALAQGLNLFGVAEITPEIFATFHPSLHPAAQKLPLALSFGVALAGTIFESLIDRPTLLYLQHYRMANLLLDQSAFKISTFIERLGYKALPIPASQIVDWQSFKGQLCHRKVARQAGLGWIGRSTLLVNPQYGARARYVTILTNLPLEPAQPMENQCGNCRACVDLCPAGAITMDSYDRQKCFELLTKFSRQDRIGQHICGLCQKACPPKYLCIC
jgi:epoxyqueuosine reductase